MTSQGERFLTAPEVAERLRTSTWVVVKACRDDKLPATKPHKEWLIAESDVEAYLARHANKATPKAAS